MAMECLKCHKEAHSECKSLFLSLSLFVVDGNKYNWDCHWGLAGISKITVLTPTFPGAWNYTYSKCDQAFSANFQLDILTAKARDARRLTWLRLTYESLVLPVDVSSWIWIRSGRSDLSSFSWRGWRSGPVSSIMLTSLDELLVDSELRSSLATCSCPRFFMPLNSTRSWIPRPTTSLLVETRRRILGNENEIEGAPATVPKSIITMR